MKRSYLIFYLFFLTTFTWADNWPNEVNQAVSEVKKSIRLIDIKGFKAVVDNPGKALIIDVRESSEYYNGYIPGAINIPRGLLEMKIWKHLGYPEKTDWDRPIYLYCSLGNRSALAAHSLTQLGLKNVTAVDMQITDWEAAGYTLDF